MAAPITSIQRKQLTQEEQQQEKLNELQTLIAEQQQSLNKILELTAELDKAGVLDAINAMVKAKDDLMGIAVNQASREPMTNLINNLMNTAGILTSINPEVTESLKKAIAHGIEEAELYKGNGDKVSILKVMTALNDPNINRAVKYGLDFLKGMGKGLED
ncbi:DUF1641 domain-containing protein [Sporosarcina thermotolerans]|uniref:DUF1641 domain-containing protein n=1 Tax=Sporosarcina thermotolerans TaxID=633404 RepID=A0AAW9AA22_9BACL|nr:DUF1641 domain-containing protein [Sporosarcina thermotolerans]MDW0117240.1 DUF1641 domain-containing protein [Sporosarcina thermotolerans]WHT47410.1 DUF1641 domain-containing protein [Sporosarcina thermotolerans]